MHALALIRANAYDRRSAYAPHASEGVCAWHMPLDELCVCVCVEAFACGCSRANEPPNEPRPVW
eukprot:6193070-Pleurochrysis_carterae.AAC.2